MDIRVALVSVMLIGALASCGPVYKTNYTFTPPAADSGRACIFQCDNSKLQCKHIQDLEYRRCEDRAERDYDRCEDRNQGRREDEKEYCYRSWCAVPTYEDCEATYRQCYQTCGGTVSSQRVCVSFCEE